VHKKRNVLGKGLSALLDKKEKPNIEILEIDPEKIIADPGQPRCEFNTEELVNLSESVRNRGIIQPIIVRRGQDDKFVIVSGERRLRAAVMVKMAQIPVIVRDFSDKAALEISLIENLQREDLKPLERAGGFENLVSRYGYTHDQIASAIGKSRVYVVNTLRLLKLNDQVKDALRQSLITEGHARALMMIKDEDFQIKVLKLIIKEGISVRQTELLAKGKALVEHRDKKPVKVYHEIEARMSEKLCTKVKVTKGGKKGKIVIEFKTEQQLNDILGYFN
jgi:ParB family chromosome partitioning protein